MVINGKCSRSRMRNAVYSRSMIVYSRSIRDNRINLVLCSRSIRDSNRNCNSCNKRVERRIVK